MKDPKTEPLPAVPPPSAGSRLKTLRNRVTGNDEWLAHAQRLYLEENRRNGQYARELRETAGVSLREVARRMGISAMMLSDLERGNRNWNVAMLSKWEGAMSSENAGSDLSPAKLDAAITNDPKAGD